MVNGHASAAFFPTVKIVFQETKKAEAYSIKIIPSAAQTFGYEIYQGVKLLIRQVNIPGLPGIKGFKTKSDAKKVAELVCQKLARGLMPPTIEKEEMRKLNVQF